MLNFLICFLNIFCRNRVKSWVTIRKLHVWMCGGLTFIPCSRKITGLTVSWDWPALLRKIPTSGFSLSQNNSIRVNSTLGLEMWMKIDTALLQPLLSYMYICPFICRAILENVSRSQYINFIQSVESTVPCINMQLNWDFNKTRCFPAFLYCWQVGLQYTRCTVVVLQYFTGIPVQYAANT